MYKTKTVKMTTNQTVRIPTTIAKRLRLKPGANFDVSLTTKGILLSPIMKVPSSQAYFWTKEWQQAEKQATEDMKKGQVESFDNADDLLAGLDA